MPSNKINVLFVIMYVQIGGIERLVYNLSRDLDRKIFNPYIAWFEGEEICKEFIDINIPLFHVPKIKRLDLRTMRRLEEIIFRNNIQIVNVHGFMNMIYSFYGAKVKNKRKLVYTVHSDWEIQKTDWKWRFISIILFKFIDSIVCVNPNFLKSIERKFYVNTDKNIAIPNGVNLASFSEKRNNYHLRYKLGLQENDIVIGQIANFKKIKNHMMLLKAFNNVIKKNTLVKLLLIGQGFKNDYENTEKDIVDYIKDQGIENNVLLLGFRSDIPELLNIMDFVCLTSIKEGLPLCLIEAMAASLPLVGTNVEGIKDVIVHNKNGFLIESNDITGLEKAMNVLIRDKILRHKFGCESKKIANDKYSLEQCIDSYQNLFLSLVKK